MSKIEKNQQKIIILINFQLKTTIKKHSPPPHQTNTQWVVISGSSPVVVHMTVTGDLHGC
jgi:hypothetical protein